MKVGVNCNNALRRCKLIARRKNLVNISCAAIIN